MDDSHFDLQAPDGAGGWKTLATGPSRATLKAQAEQMKERPLRIVLEQYDVMKSVYTSTVVETLAAQTAPSRDRSRPAPSRAKSTPPQRKPAPLPWWKKLLGLK